MPKGKRDGLLIAGGGIAGCLAALAMARFRPEVPLLIVEEDGHFGGGDYQLLFDAEIDAGARPLLAPIVRHHWSGFYVAFPDLSRKLRIPLSGFGGDAIHRAMIEALRPDQYRLRTKVVAVREDALVLDGGETIKADGALDARGIANQSMLNLAWLVRVERDYRTSAPHGLDRPVLVDTSADGANGLGFVQALPLSPDRLLLAEVLVAEGSQPGTGAVARLDTYCALRGWSVAAARAPATIARPLPHGGDFDAFWRIGGARVGRLGRRGGFQHPLSGGIVADAAQIAMLLARQTDLEGAALHDLLETEAKNLWRQRAPQRAVVAAIASTEPSARRATIERLFRLDVGVVARLLSDRLGMVDRMHLSRVLRA